MSKNKSVLERYIEHFGAPTLDTILEIIDSTKLPEDEKLMTIRGIVYLMKEYQEL